jgi:serine/threonine-protein kinase haspin
MDVLMSFVSHLLASKNDRPSESRCKDHVSMEMRDGGQALADFHFVRNVEAVSVFKQVACALAVAEAAVEFEHRDLHDGNVLVERLANDAVSTVSPLLLYGSFRVWFEV